MVSRRTLSPALCAAAGAGIGFYCLSVLYRSGAAGIYLVLFLLFLPVAALCLLRVLALFPVRENAGGAASGAASGETGKTRTVKLARRYTAAFAAGLALGLGAGSTLSPKIAFGVPEDAVRGVSGVLLEDPRLVSGGRAMARLSLRRVISAGGVRVTARGELPVFFPEESSSRLRESGRGAEVFIEGELRKRAGGAAGGQQAYSFSAAAVHVTKPAPALERFRTGLRLDLIRRFDRASWGGLALALLLGIRDSLDSGLAADYRDAGCSYILALSGMHLAVLASLIAFLLKKPLGLNAAALAGAAIIIVYCFVVGPLPSLNRAALMYLIGTLAVLGALPREAFTVLCLSFLIQITVSPGSGVSLSFILSYLALAGILSAGESLNALFEGKIPAFLLRPLSASLGAFIITAGVTAFSFGSLRPIGIAAGLVLVPLTTIFMVASMAWLGLDLISPVLSGIVSPALSGLYAVMEKTVRIASRAPGLTLNPHAVLWTSLALTVFIVWFEIRSRKARNRLAPFA